MQPLKVKAKPVAANVKDEAKTTWPAADMRAR
jgi:hypothetical protein